MYCALCQRPVDAKRRIGLGTVCLTVVTGGLWLVAVPFYRRRCAICDSTAVSAQKGEQVADLEEQLYLARRNLDETTAELERLREERAFDQQLLEKRTSGGTPETESPDH